MNCIGWAKRTLILVEAGLLWPFFSIGPHLLADVAQRPTPILAAWHDPAGYGFAAGLPDFGMLAAEETVSSTAEAIHHGSSIAGKTGPHFLGWLISWGATEPGRTHEGAFRRLTSPEPTRLSLP